MLMFSTPVEDPHQFQSKQDMITLAAEPSHVICVQWAGRPPPGEPTNPTIVQNMLPLYKNMPPS